MARQKKKNGFEFIEDAQKQMSDVLLRIYEDDDQVGDDSLDDEDVALIAASVAHVRAKAEELRQEEARRFEVRPATDFSGVGLQVVLDSLAGIDRRTERLEGLVSGLAESLAAIHDQLSSPSSGDADDELSVTARSFRLKDRSMPCAARAGAAVKRTRTAVAPGKHAKKKRSTKKKSASTEPQPVFSSRAEAR